MTPTTPLQPARRPACRSGRLSPHLAALLAGALALALPGMAQAYVGPGAGLTAIGTVLALIGAVFFALVGFVWYPVKRLLRRGRPATSTATSAGTDLPGDRER
ncbi:hypothetical protein V8J36_08305 [Frigidibacter sp. MR17.14]|uniref:hypothetical protein n=1 Tax=Frigidibacter sp. MR17.14 TaxID=3126509 RepID=UPI003012BC17